MEKDVPQLKKDEHKSIQNLNSMNFIELIQLWRELACYYNKVARELPFKKDSTGSEKVQECGFAYRDDVPLFRIGRSCMVICPFNTFMCYEYKV